MLGNLKQMKRTIEGLKAFGDPNIVYNMMLQRNPQLKDALDYVNKNGGDPKTVAESLLKESGFDLSELINMI